MNGSYDHPYTDAKAPIHIITGSAVTNYFWLWVIEEYSKNNLSLIFKNKF